MTAIKYTEAVTNIVSYTIYDESGNKVDVRVGIPLCFGGDMGAGLATIALKVDGMTIRFTKAQTPLGSATSPTVDADGRVIRYGTHSPVTYAGGKLQATSAGVRVIFGGQFVDFTTANMSDLDTIFAEFTSSGMLA